MIKRPLIQTLAASAAAATLAFGAAPIAAHEDERDERAEAAFEELTEGRVAGEPRRCLRTFVDHRLRVEENVGLVYERGDTIWIARARHPNRLDAWDVPVIERYGSQLCRTDVMRTIDRSSGTFSGVLILDDFVPWTVEGEEEDG